MNIIAGHERILIKANREKKNSFQLTEDVNIKLVRGIENFDRKQTEPVQGIVVNSEIVPIGSEVLMAHNSLHPVNEIFDHKLELDDNEVLYAIPKREVYFYKEKGGNWKPLEGYLVILKLFKPYSGILQGIPPTEIVDKFWVVEGEYKHQVVIADKFCFYTIIFQGEKGREEHVSRMRSDEFELHGISGELTEHVLSGELLIGETAETAKKFELPTVE